MQILQDLKSRVLILIPEARVSVEDKGVTDARFVSMAAKGLNGKTPPGGKPHATDGDRASVDCNRRGPSISLNFQSRGKPVERGAWQGLGPEQHNSA